MYFCTPLPKADVIIMSHTYEILMVFLQIVLDSSGIIGPYFLSVFMTYISFLVFFNYKVLDQDMLFSFNICN